MLRRLNAFYESHGISPSDFRCSSLSACSAGSPHFTEAKMSFVGPRYGMRLVERANAALTLKGYPQELRLERAKTMAEMVDRFRQGPGLRDRSRQEPQNVKHCLQYVMFR